MIIMLPRSKNEPHSLKRATVHKPVPFKGTGFLTAVDLVEYNFLISYHIRLDLSTSKESDE
jgi:hypothetical protein